MNTTPTEYTDRAATMTAEEQAAIAQIVREKFKQLRDLAGNHEKTAIAGAELARFIGAQLELFTGHKSIAAKDFSKLALEIPDATLTFAQKCVSVHRQNAQPITEYSQAIEDLWKEIRVQMELLPKGSHGEQKRHLHEPVKDAIAKFTAAKAEMLSTIKDQPPEQWQWSERKHFLAEAKPIHDLYEQVLKIQDTKTIEA